MRVGRQHRLTYLFITHDLAVVLGIADPSACSRRDGWWKQARQTLSSPRHTTSTRAACSPPSPWSPTRKPDFATGFVAPRSMSRRPRIDRQQSASRSFRPERSGRGLPFSAEWRGCEEGSGSKIGTPRPDAFGHYPVRLSLSVLSRSRLYRHRRGKRLFGIGCAAPLSLGRQHLPS
jgi:hypothetical protein